MASKNQRKFRSLCGKWKERLWLSHWYVDFDYPDHIDEGAHEGWQTTARVRSRSAYHTANVAVAAKAVASESETNMNRQACHEMIHVALSPLNDMCVEIIKSLPAKQADAFDRWRWKENESVTEHLTNVLLAAFKEKQSD